MKVLKAKIEVDHSSGGTRYIYPSIWLENKEKIPSILYPGNRLDEVEENGKTYQIVYPCIPLDLVSAFLANPNFSVCTEDEVRACSDKHYPESPHITDEARVIAILAKSARGEELLPEESAAIDPNNPEPGITTSPKWSDRMKNEYGATFG